LGGAFVIRGNVSHFAVEADGGEMVMHLLDWYHAEETQLVQGVIEKSFRWAGDPQSVLVNGKGHFNCTDNVVYACSGGVCVEGQTSAALHSAIAGNEVDENEEVCGAQQRPWYRPSYHPPSCDTSLCPGTEKMEVTAGKTYLLRFINGGSLSLFNVAIQNHSMTVVEVDGWPTQKYRTDSVDLNSGQRVSVLVTMDQPPDVYVVRVAVRARSAQRFGHALIEYAGSPTAAEDVDPAAAPVSQPAWNDNNYTLDFQQAIRGLYSGDAGVEEVPADDQVRRTFYMLNTQERMDEDSIQNAVPSVDNLTVALGEPGQRPQDYCDSEGNTKPLRWLLGRRWWQGSATPTLSSIYFGIDSERLTENNGYYQVEVGEVYDAVIQNYPACNGVCETHALHIHGMHFWVLGTGRGEWTGSADQLASLNKQDPAYRDVVQTVGEGVDNKPWSDSEDYGPCGWTMIRFLVQSPGAWFFHCHQLWHIIMGSNAVLFTNASSIPEPPSNLLLCGDMTAEAVSEKVTQLAREREASGRAAASGALAWTVAFVATSLI
jgi:L-ascorbate oxidase